MLNQKLILNNVVVYYVIVENYGIDVFYVKYVVEFNVIVVSYGNVVSCCCT